MRACACCMHACTDHVSLLELPFSERCDREFFVGSIYLSKSLSRTRWLYCLHPPPKKKKNPQNPKQHTIIPHTPYAAGGSGVRSSQMQNRLDTTAEAQAASKKQLADVQSAIAAELAARPKSVKFLPSSKFPPGSLLTHMAGRIGAVRS